MLSIFDMLGEFALMFGAHTGLDATEDFLSW